MTYQALYRTFRPQTFTDVVGQPHITRTLQNAIVHEKFSHAYIFSGPRGTGKTSAAKIFAKTINCEHAPTSEPCNECHACLGIQDGSITDVIEMDAASNTSVDDIRAIRDRVKYAPSSVPYKVYIIDEVHMISNNAFNALLKTLEEPPSHVVFILATTEPHKIPMTIISRCQCFDFKPISNRSIVGQLKKVTESENVSVTDDALDTIALSADGGMRDGLSILDQAISYSDDVVELEDVLAITGAVSQGVLTDIIKYLYDREAVGALDILDDLIQGGKDPGRFVFDMIYFLRDMLMYKQTTSGEDILERALLDDDFKTLTENVPTEWIEESIFAFNQCEQNIKFSNSPKIFIEMAMMELTQPKVRQNQAHIEDSSLETSATIQKLSQKLAFLEKELNTLKQAPTQKQTAQQQSRKPRQQPKKSEYRVLYKPIREVLENADKSLLKNMKSNWRAFLDDLRMESKPAEAMMQKTEPVAVSQNGIVISYTYEVHCTLSMQNKDIIEPVLSRIAGRPVTMYAIPEYKWKPLRQEYVDGKEHVSKEEGSKEEDPVITEARNLFGDDLLDIHD